MVMVPELYFCEPFSVLTSKPDEWEEVGFPHASVSSLTCLPPSIRARPSAGGQSPRHPRSTSIQLQVSSQESRDVLEGTLETSHARPQHLQDWLASWSHGRVCLPLLPNAALSSNYRVWILGQVLSGLSSWGQCTYDPIATGGKLGSWLQSDVLVTILCRAGD